MCLAVGGEVPLIFARAAEELVFAAAEVECVEGGWGFLPPDGFGVGSEVHSGHAVAIEGQPRVLGGNFHAQGGELGVFADNQHRLRREEAVDQAHRLRIMPRLPARR